MLKISVLVLFLHFADGQNKPCEFLRFSSELITELRSILVWKVQSNSKPSLIKQKPHIFFSPYPFLPAFWLLIFFIEYDFTLCWERRVFASWLNLELTAMTRKKVSGNEEMTRKKGITFFSCRDMIGTGQEMLALRQCVFYPSAASPSPGSINVSSFSWPCLDDHAANKP